MLSSGRGEQGGGSESRLQKLMAIGFSSFCRCKGAGNDGGSALEPR